MIRHTVETKVIILAMSPKCASIVKEALLAYTTPDLEDGDLMDACIQEIEDQS